MPISAPAIPRRSYGSAHTTTSPDPPLGDTLRPVLGRVIGALPRAFACGPATLAISRQSGHYACGDRATRAVRMRSSDRHSPRRADLGLHLSLRLLPETQW